MTTSRTVAEARALLRLLTEKIDSLDDPGLDELTQIEGVQWLFEYSAAMIEYYLHADPAHPVIMPMVTPFRRFLGDLRLAKHCYVARLDAAYTYRLRCEPGDAAFTSITVHADESGGFAGNRTLGKLNHREITADADGSFQVTIGPHERGSNTITIDDSVSSLMTREFFDTDDSDRREARWSIDIIGTEPGTTVARADDTSVAHALAWAVANLGDALPRYPRAIAAPVFVHASINQFADFFAFDTTAVTTWGNLDALHTTMAYDLEPGHAIVIDGGPTVPCAWWGLSQNNRYLASFGRGEPTALAGRALTLDADGAWRVVLSAENPGVANWLSTAGHRNGVLRIRWMLADTTPAKPTTTVVRTEDVAGTLDRPHE